MEGKASTTKLTLTWLLLVLLTLSGLLLGDSQRPGWPIVLMIALVMALKGRLVIDQFMELGTARRGIRRPVRLFALLFPGMVLLVYFLGDEIARLTTL